MMVLFALLGLLVGALTNLLATSLVHRGRPTLPTCTSCARVRPWSQWISLPSALLRRARCPHCDARIGIRHPLVELGLAAAYAYLWWLLAPSPTLIPALYYTAVLAIVLVTDLEHRTIPNAILFPAIAFAAAVSLYHAEWWSGLLGGAVLLIPFVIAKVVGSLLFGPSSLGGGDLKLALFVGLMTGLPLALLALVLATGLGALVALVLLITGRKGLLDTVPYGPFLVVGGWVAMVWGEQILSILIRVN
jgi:leader peptidase (prepilin peptidase)/N-methyltransferase